MRVLFLSSFVFALASWSLTSAAAGAVPPQQDPAPVGAPVPIYVTHETLVGAEVRAPNGARVGEIEDLIFDLGARRATGVLLESGLALELDRVRWDPRREVLIEGDPVRDQGQGWVTAAASTDEAVTAGGSPGLRASGARMMAAGLKGAPLQSTMPSTELDEDRLLGTVGGLVFDVRTGHLAFVATSVGGLLGIGAQSKPIPAHAVELVRVAGTDGVAARVHLTSQRLKDAPSWDSSGRALQRAAFRDRLYSYYGVERPRYDWRTEDGQPHFVAFPGLVGVDLRDSDGRVAEVADILLARDDARATHFLLESGAIVPLDGLRWNDTERHFDHAGALPREAASGWEATHVRGRALIDATLYSVSATDGQDYGLVDTVYFDMDRRVNAYAAVRIGESLGIAGDVHLLPWSVVQIASRDDAVVAVVGLAKRHLGESPVLSGEDGESLYNPDFRARVDHYREIAQQKADG